MIGCVEAEAAFLGALLQTASPAITNGLLRQIEEQDLTDPRHRAVYVAMTELLAAGCTVDPVTVLGQLRRTGLEQSMTDDRSAGVFLADLLAAAPSVASSGHYLRIVLEHRLRAGIENAGVRFQQVAGTSDLDSLRERVRVDCSELARLFGRVAARECAEVSA